MRYQGKIVEWNDARGFGFAVPNGGGVRAFVHISALQHEQRRPRLDDAVIYEVQTDARGRPNAVNVQLVFHGLAGRAASHPANRSRRVARAGRRAGWLWRAAVIALVMVAMTQWRMHRPLAGDAGNAAAEGPAKHLARPTPAAEPAPSVYENPVEEPSYPTPTLPIPEPLFRCEGKTRCPQMRSCEEAMFYQRNCSGTQMDGDGDGIPCESQWCGG